MRRSILTAVAGAIALIATLACRHQPITVSTTPTNPPPRETVPMQVDQVNTAGWDKGWTNLVNDTEQSFIPTQPRLRGVEVELIVANPGDPDDELTLTIRDAQGQKVATVTQIVKVDDADHVMFLMSNDGISLTPGRVYTMQLAGGRTFGWKYVAGGYEKGEATFNGKPLLADARSTFLFRTFGSQ